jgi:hypothetical protein
MLLRLAHAALRPLMQLWLRFSSRSWMTLMRPEGHPSVHSRGANPDRMLLVGAGLSVGFGVLTHELAFAGYLARSVSAHTHRGTDIDIIADPAMTLASCVPALRGVELARFDAVVVTLGGRDALELRSIHTWKRDLARLLDAVSAQAPQGMHVFVVSVAPAHALLGLPFLIERVVDSHTRLVNAASRSIIERRSGVSFLEFEAWKAHKLLSVMKNTVYEDLATEVAPTVATQLDLTGGASRRHEPANERARQDAVDELGILDADPDENFEWVARLARDLFGSKGASVTFLDHSRQFVMAAAGLSRIDTPRALAFCEFTIRRSEIFVVEDASKDERFAQHPWVRGGSDVQFYAGYPLEAPNGQRVGALCIVDSKPRKFSTSDAALLRDLALQVQGILWRSGSRLTSR